MFERKQGRRRCLAWLASAMAGAAAAPAFSAPAAVVGDALGRPALTTRNAERSVLLAADRAGSRLVAVGERGIVVLSDDQGERWRQAPTPLSVTLTAVRFANASRGYALGHGGAVLATDDGGQGWKQRLDGRQIAQLLLAQAKASGDGAAVASAERMVADGADKPLLDLVLFDAQRLLVVGAYGVALASGDGGATWESWRARLDNPKELHLYAARQRGSRIVIAGEQGLVLLSEDGGRGFKRLTLPYSGSFFTAELPDDQTIVVAGLRGNAWRSTNAGTTWQQLASPVPVSITGSALDAAGRVLFVNQAGMVLGLQGDELQPLGGAPLPPLNAILALADGQALALSVQGVQRVNLQPGNPR